MIFLIVYAPSEVFLLKKYARKKLMRCLDNKMDVLEVPDELLNGSSWPNLACRIPSW